ncbi:MAG: sigma factor-like helix-turn-helix DNA-binding protein [Anaerovoracaceae bacterium]|nr:DNA-binding protein [Clostridiales bacterium]
MRNVARISLLLDFYEKLLPERQKEAIRLYNEENFSLSEIAELFGISRQGVHDAIRKGETALTGYEEKLGFLRLMEVHGKAVEDLKNLALQIKEKDKAIPSEKLLEGLKKVIEALDKQEN